MLHFEAFFHHESDQLDRIYDEALNTICQHLLLCASVGCVCVMGKGKGKGKGKNQQKQCNEVYHGKKLRVSVSEGPTWCVIAYRLRESTHIDIYLDARPPVEQLRELMDHLRSYGGRFYWRHSSRAHTMEERNART